MATTIAKYYAEELKTWNHHINSYRREMFEMERRLAEVIHRNTIPNIADLVEEQQGRLNKIAIKFFQLLEQFQKQRVALKQDSNLIDDTLINAEVEKHQNALRKFMQQSEKDYIDIKHECSGFISDTLRKRK